MQRITRTLVVILGISLAATAQNKSPSKAWRGTWSATVGNGARVFGGTWDATLGDDPDTVIGNWAITDQSGTTMASGTWAAHKDEKVWRGSWQARVASGQVYSGTWRAQAQLASTARISELFELSLGKAVSGTWRMGGEYAGAWSIRAYGPE